MEDTICSIATSVGIGAISIIRVSGEKAIAIVNKIFKGKNLENCLTHTIHYGYIYEKNEKIDEVLVSVMRAPKTYTTEDIVEINTHGGFVTTNKILELLLENGCRLAEPGEFTKRAFLNGRIDLTQAESVNDLILAKTDKARDLALHNLDGQIKRKINKICTKLMDIMANIEVNIDYPEYEDIEVITNEKVLPILNVVKKELEDILANSKNGKLIKDGIDVAIVGRPNVGKSSILNHLLKEDKAIVTNIAGTTRDIVEGAIILNGFLINLIDTAGLRKTKDVVESIGVEKSKDVMHKADVVIAVLNNEEGITKEDEELIASIPVEKRIVFVNKSDIKNNRKINYIKGNTKTDDGLDTLKKEIVNKLQLDKINSKDMTYVANARQIDLIKKTFASIESALSNIDSNMPIDIVEIDINNAWKYLKEITGEVYEDELINTLFSNFCVGK